MSIENHAEAIESWLAKQENFQWLNYIKRRGSSAVGMGYIARLENSRSALAGTAESAIESFAQDEEEALRMRRVIEVVVSAEAFAGYVAARAYISAHETYLSSLGASEGDDSVE